MWLLLPACKAVDPAPKELDALLHWFWQGNDDLDDASLAGGLVNLDAAIHAPKIDGPEDGSVSRLSDDEIALVGITDQDAHDAVGLYVLNSFDCSWDQLRKILSYPQQDELYDDGTYTKYSRTFDQGNSRDEWLARDQPRLEYDIDYSAKVLGTAFDAHSRGALRTIPDQGPDVSPYGEFVIQRSYAKGPAEYTGDTNKSMDQDYQLELYWTHGGHIKHAYGIWRQASFGSSLDLEDLTAQRLLLNAFEDWDGLTAQNCADGRP